MGRGEDRYIEKENVRRNIFKRWAACLKGLAY
jgi:hypothetical protein